MENRGWTVGFIDGPPEGYSLEDANTDMFHTVCGTKSNPNAGKYGTQEFFAVSMLDKYNDAKVYAWSHRIVTHGGGGSELTANGTGAIRPRLNRRTVRKEDMLGLELVESWDLDSVARVDCPKENDGTKTAGSVLGSSASVPDDPDGRLLDKWLS
jgi:hypothetical protein